VVTEIRRFGVQTWALGSVALKSIREMHEEPRGIRGFEASI